MIDEFFLRVVDSLCDSVPKFMKPKLVRLSSTSVGWRIYLYAGTAIEKLSRVSRFIGKEEDVSRAVDAMTGNAPKKKKKKPHEETPEEYEERIRRQIDKIIEDDDKKAKAEQEKRESRLRMARMVHGVCANVERAVASVFLPVMLALIALSALGAAATGRAALGAFGAMCMLLYWAIAMERDYEPLCAGVRQRYLAAMFLRAGAYTVMMLFAFSAYLGRGVATNVVLQGAMVLMLSIHLLLFMCFVAFERRQMLMLRLLSLLLGTPSVLMAAACLSLGVSQLAMPQGGALAGVLQMIGALMMYACEHLRMTARHGSLRFTYRNMAEEILTLCGMILILLGAWLGAY